MKLFFLITKRVPRQKSGDLNLAFRWLEWEVGPQRSKGVPEPGEKSVRVTWDILSKWGKRPSAGWSFEIFWRNRTTSRSGLSEVMYEFHIEKKQRQTNKNNNKGTLQCVLLAFPTEVPLHVGVAHIGHMPKLLMYKPWSQNEYVNDLQI